VLFLGNSCPFTQAAYLQILNMLISYSLEQKLRIYSVDSSLSRPLWTGVPPNSPPDLLKEAELHRVLLSSQLDCTPDVSNLVRLAELDANACSSVLKELMPLTSELSDRFKSSLVWSVWQILSNSRNDDLIYMAETVMCQILDQGNYAQGIRAHILVKVRNRIVASSSISPLVTESGLGLWSKCLQLSFVSNLPTEDIAEEVDCILRTIHPLLDVLMVS
jgi:hypothetical protein